MKPLLFAAALFSFTAVLGQTTDANKVLGLQEYLKQESKINPTKITPQLLNKRKQYKVELITRNNTTSDSKPVKGSMPVWSPDSNYVFNMPGTHAYDQPKYTMRALFVEVKPEGKTGVIRK